MKKLSLEKMKENLLRINNGGNCLYCNREKGDHVEDEECIYEISIQKYNKDEFFDNHFYYR